MHWRTLKICRLQTQFVSKCIKSQKLVRIIKRNPIRYNVGDQHVESIASKLKLPKQWKGPPIFLYGIRDSLSTAHPIELHIDSNFVNLSSAQYERIKFLTQYNVTYNTRTLTCVPPKSIGIGLSNYHRTHRPVQKIQALLKFILLEGGIQCAELQDITVLAPRARRKRNYPRFSRH